MRRRNGKRTREGVTAAVKEQKRKLTVSQQLGIAVGLVVSVGIAAITLFAYIQVREGALDAARQRLGDVAAQLESIFEQSGRSRLAALRRVAESPETNRFLRHVTRDTSAALATLRSVVSEQNSTVELWDAVGTRVAQVGVPRAPVSDAMSSAWRMAADTGRGGIVTPLRLDADTVRYSVIVPVPDSAGRTIGYIVQRQPVAAGAAARDRLSRLLGSDAHVYVGNAAGDVWTDFSTRAPAPPVAVGADTTLLEYTRPGTGGQLAVARPMVGLPWLLLVEFPRGVVLSRTDRFLRDAGVAALFLIALVGLVGWRYLRRVTRPIEGALEESEARFEAILERTPNGVVMVDQQGRMRFVNAEIERLFGYTRAELLGQAVEQLIPQRMADAHRQYRADSTRQLHGREMGMARDLVALRKDGTEFPVVVGLNPVTRDGEVYVVASVIDISARKQAELELERSNGELQRFAYVASHDLQEPLRTVASYVQLIERRYGDRLDSDGKDFMAFIVDGARRMQSMVNDLLTLSRVGERGADLVPTSADEALDRAMRDLALALAESGATVTRAPLPTVRGDARQLEQLFANLLGNAMKFAGAHPPRIEIAARRVGPQWAFSVRDHGIGIEPEYFDRIFVIFQRLHSRDEYPGTGIGLALCKKIVERHGGRIWVDSEPGHGATFNFTLHATAQEA